MSIKVMSRVWEKSNQKGSDLLLLLAIADNANDDGFAFPGQKYLANKIRMSVRSVSRIADNLVKSGELFINHQINDGQNNQYVVTLDLTWEEFSTILKSKLGYSTEKIEQIREWFNHRGDDNLSTPQGVTSCQGGDDIAMSGGDDIAMSGGDDIAMSSEPSITVNESSNNHHHNGRIYKTAFEAYENEVGLMTAIISQDIGSAIEDYTEGWVIDAICLAAKNNVRKWSYASGILKRWHANGRSDSHIKKEPEKVLRSEDGGYYV